MRDLGVFTYNHRETALVLKDINQNKKSIRNSSFSLGEEITLINNQLRRVRDMSLKSLKLTLQLSLIFMLITNEFDSNIVLAMGEDDINGLTEELARAKIEDNTNPYLVRYLDNKKAGIYFSHKANLNSFNIN